MPWPSAWVLSMPASAGMAKCISPRHSEISMSIGWNRFGSTVEGQRTGLEKLPQGFNAAFLQHIPGECMQELCSEPQDACSTCKPPPPPPLPPTPGGRRTLALEQAASPLRRTGFIAPNQPQHTRWLRGRFSPLPGCRFCCQLISYRRAYILQN